MTDIETRRGARLSLSSPPPGEPPRSAALAVVIGRFQPPHAGHHALLERAFSLARHVVVVVGSACAARSLKAPLRWREVEALLRADLDPLRSGRMTVVGVPDAYNDAAWAASVRRAVMEAAKARGGDAGEVRLVGHRKDETSYYLSLFPDWSLDDAPLHGVLNATDFRDAWLREGEAVFERLGGMLLPGALGVLRDFTRTPAYAWLSEERADLDRRLSAAPGGRLPVALTADGVVLRGDRVMMVTRAKLPGRGLLSMPGGYLKDGETARQTLVGNLVADHGLFVPEMGSRMRAAQFLDRCITAQEVFDHPGRSARGRAVSLSFLVELPVDGAALPDLRQGPLGPASWHALDDLAERSEGVFDDHLHIVRRLAARASWRV